MVKVVKRDGSKVSFDIEKIKSAIAKCLDSVYKDKNVVPLYGVKANGFNIETVSQILSEIVGASVTSNKKKVDIETIQDTVEKVLMWAKLEDAAKAYILYREQHAKIREDKSIIDMITETVDSYIEKSTWLVNENANMSFSIQGLNSHIVSKVSENYWLNKVFSKRIRDAHFNGDIHVHDAGTLQSYCFTGDTKVKLLDGHDVTMKELATNKKYRKGFYVYSCTSTGFIIPGWAHSARKTRKKADLVEVTLDNDEKIKCTHDHRFMLRNGKYKKAANLKPSDSLMPLYLNKAGGKYREYITVNINNNAQKPNKSSWNNVYVHHIVANDYFDYIPDDYIIHHKNGIKTDNRPINLDIMKDSEHRRLELAITKEKEEWKASNKKMLSKRNKSKRHRNIVSKKMIEYNKSELGRAISSYGNSIRFDNKIKDIASRDEYLEYVDKFGYISFKEYLKDKTKVCNHKVKEIRFLETKEDVYDFTVDKYHNFALSAGIFVHNCSGWDLKDFLLYGFKNGIGDKIDSKPPKHLLSALGILTNALYTLQGEFAGAQAVSNFDTLMAPFIRYDNLDYKEVYQMMQYHIFQMNVPTRLGLQTPFTNYTMDLTCPEMMKNEPVIIGGKPHPEWVYGDFQAEMDMLNKAFCEVMIEGDIKGRAFPFPIPTYNITKDFDWDNKKLEPLWEMTGKYGVPYFANYINSEMKPEDATSMCCRLKIDRREIVKRGGSLFGASPKTGSIGVVSINMPRIGYLAKTENEFFELLDNRIQAAKEVLEIKRKQVEKWIRNGLYPYARYYLQDTADRKDSKGYFMNHFSTIGVVGMNEACLNFMDEQIYDNKAHHFAQKVLNYMRNKVREIQLETGNLYNLEQSPAEKTAGKFAMLDKEKYPDIKTMGNNDIPYYTNSSHLPVDYTNDIHFIATHQQQLNRFYNGGTACHFFANEMLTPEQAKMFVKSITSNYKLEYFTYSPVYTICPVHGFIPGEHRTCPYYKG